jgi:hypothetical protein
MKVTLTKVAPVGAAFTLTTSPLQISIGRDSIMKQGDLLIVEVEHEEDEWDELFGLDMVDKDTYIYAVKPGSYRLKLLQFKDATSVEAVMM